VRRAVLQAAILVLAADATVWAQAVPPPGAQPGVVRPAPRLQTNAITLSDAIQSTIERNPTLALAAATTDVLTGQWQTTRGTFDARFQVTPSALFHMQPVQPGLLANASRARETLVGIVNNFTQLTGVLQTSIRNNQIVAPRCPGNLVFSFGGFQVNNAFLLQPVNVDRIDPAEQTALGTKTFLNGTPIGDILSGINLTNICTNTVAAGLSPSNFFQAIRDIANTHAIDQEGGQGLNGFLASTSQIIPEIRLSELSIFNTAAIRGQLALERLGPLPVDDIQRTTALDVTFFKPFRSGINLTANYTTLSVDHKFRDKPYDPSFGGLGLPPEFASGVQFTLAMPLGKGRGSTGLLAPERAANFMVLGQRENVRHSATEEAFRTSLAYLNVVAAQQTLAVLQESQTRQQRLVQLTEQAVQLGDLPRVEIDRARARATRVDSAVSGARAALVTARVSLAEAIGVEAQGLEGTPLPTENFSSSVVTLPPVDQLVTRALSLRRDVRVRQQQEMASETLRLGAVANLRRRFDFSLNGGYANIYDSPIYRYLPDEQNPIIPTSTAIVERAIHYYSPRGYYRAVKGRYEPFINAQFSVNLPFANNGARGRLRQAESTLSSSRIDAQDLNRSIRENVVDVAGQLERSAASLERWEAAVRADEETLQGVLQRFEIREVTLIDALITEEATTRDKLQLISQRQIYLSTLARLKFETGELLTFDTEGPSLRTFKFDPSFLVGR
jgi:outer membrane protein TolC